MQPCSPRDGTWELPQGRQHGMEVSGTQSHYGSPPFPLLLSILCSPPSSTCSLPSGLLPGGDDLYSGLQNQTGWGVRLHFRASRQSGFTSPPHSRPPPHTHTPSIPVMVRPVISGQTAQLTHLLSFTRHSTLRQWCREQSCREREGIRGELRWGSESAQHKPAGIRRSSHPALQWQSLASAFKWAWECCWTATRSAPLSTGWEEGELAGLLPPPQPQSIPGGPPTQRGAAWGNWIASQQVSFSWICSPCARWNQTGEETLGRSCLALTRRSCSPGGLKVGLWGLAGRNTPQSSEENCSVQGVWACSSNSDLGQDTDLLETISS